MKNISIIFKFMLILGVFGLFAIGVAIYTASQMRNINNNYSNLITGGATGAIELARADLAFQTARDGIAETTITLSSAQNAVAKTVYDEGDEAFATDLDKAIADTPDFAADLTALKSQGLEVLHNQCGKTYTMGQASTTTAGNLVAQSEFLNNCSPKFGPISQALKQEVDKIQSAVVSTDNALTNATNNTIMVTYAGILGGLAAVMALGFFAIRIWIIHPLESQLQTMRKLSGGDYSAQVPDSARQDELGRIARAVQIFKDAGLEKRRLEQEAAAASAAREQARAKAEAEREAAIQQQQKTVNAIAAGLEKLSAGDLLFRLSNTFPAEYEKLRTDFNAAMERLQSTMQSIAANTAGVRAGAGEISQASDDLSHRTVQQAASLEETAAALDEITATVARTADGAKAARTAASEARSDADRSGAVVNQTVSAMSGIETSSKQIGNIIGVIDEIAFQTNLLALNAGVEAARAGDAGRGFAVVATEVRVLAQRSADAAKEIKTLISASGAQVATGVRLVAETGKALHRIADQVAKLDTLVNEIAASTVEQATALTEVNTAVNSMDKTTQQNTAMVQQSNAASHSLVGEAEALAELISHFQIDQTTHHPTTSHKPPHRPEKSRIPVNAPTASPKQPANADANWAEF